MLHYHRGKGCPIRNLVETCLLPKTHRKSQKQGLRKREGPVPGTVSPVAQASASHKTKMSPHPKALNRQPRPHPVPGNNHGLTHQGGLLEEGSEPDAPGRGPQAEVIYHWCDFRRHSAETLFYLISSSETRTQLFTPHFLPCALIYLLAVTATKKYLS